MQKLRKLVKMSVDKRITINKLVKTCCSFDPNVRDDVMTNEECQEGLHATYNERVNSRFASAIFPARQLESIRSQLSAQRMHILTVHSSKD